MKRLFCITIDIDTHRNLRALKAFFESQYLLQQHGVAILQSRTDYTKHGWHILFTCYCTESIYWQVRKLFDDHIRYEIDRHRQDWRFIGVLWDTKSGYSKFTDVDITRMSLVNMEAQHDTMQAL